MFSQGAYTFHAVELRYFHLYLVLDVFSIAYVPEVKTSTGGRDCCEGLHYTYICCTITYAIKLLSSESVI